VRFSFAGSDVLAAQIRADAKPDVYAATNTTLPDALYPITRTTSRARGRHGRCPGSRGRPRRDAGHG
jgi:hypothetical protein